MNLALKRSVLMCKRRILVTLLLVVMYASFAKENASGLARKCFQAACARDGEHCEFVEVPGYVFSTG